MSFLSGIKSNGFGSLRRNGDPSHRTAFEAGHSRLAAMILPWY